MTTHPHTTEQVKAIVEEFEGKLWTEIAPFSYTMIERSLDKPENMEMFGEKIKQCVSAWLTTTLTTAITAAEERERERISQNWQSLSHTERKFINPTDITPYQ